MARILYVAKLAVDRDTGLPLPSLAGQSVQIVKRGTSTPVTIWENEAGTLVIPSSLRTVSSQLFIPSFWVNDTDLPVSALGGGVEVPLESAEGIAKRLDTLEPALVAASTAAVDTAASVATFQKWIELGITRRNFCTNPTPGSMTGWLYQLGTGETNTQTIESGAGPDGRPGFLRVTITAAKSGGNSGFYRNEAARSGVSGNVTTAALWVRSSAAVQVNLNASARAGATPVGTGTSGTRQLQAGVWLRLEASATATGTFDNFQVWPSLTSGNVLPVGATFDVARCLISDVAGEYFDGDTPSTQYMANRWSGTANASVSEQLDMTILTPEGASVAWGSISDRPATFPPSLHSHDASAITSGVFPIARIATGTPTGTKFVRDDGTLAEPPGTGGGGTGIIGAPSTWPATFPPSTHAHPPTDITGSSALGRSILAAADAAAVRGAIGAGTSSVTIGGAASGAAAPATHTHTPAQVGLGNVNNTSDADKPVSSATAAELDTKAPSTHTHPTSQVTGLAAALTARVQVVAVSTGTEARPSGSSVVLWIGGSTQPEAMAQADIWLQEV